MKKILMAAAVLCCMTMTVLTSCTVDDTPAPNPEPEKLADVTILWYGTTERYQYVDNGGDSSSGSLASYVFKESGTWPSTFADTYQQTTFDRLVGWSRWLLINESAPPAWSPSSFKFSLPEDDMSEIPVL